MEDVVDGVLVVDEDVSFEFMVNVVNPSTCFQEGVSLVFHNLKVNGRERFVANQAVVIISYISEVHKNRVGVFGFKMIAFQLRFAGCRLVIF